MKTKTKKNKIKRERKEESQKCSSSSYEYICVVHAAHVSDQRTLRIEEVLCHGCVCARGRTGGVRGGERVCWTQSVGDVDV